MTTIAEKPAMSMAGFDRAEYDINGIRTVVHSIGSGPVLVFLHGTGTFTGFEAARVWAKSHRVVIPYHPGFGELGDAVGLDTMEDYVLHYMDLFDRLNLKGFDLAGFSLGGWLAAEYAVRQPERLRRLVLIAPVGLVVESAPAPDIFKIPPPELPAYLACDPAAVLRYSRNSPTPPSRRAWAARSAASQSSWGRIRRATPNSGAGCTASRCRRWCSGAPTTV